MCVKVDVITMAMLYICDSTKTAAVINILTDDVDIQSSLLMFKDKISLF